MRAGLFVLLVTTASPHVWADPALQEYNAAQPVAPAYQLRQGPCDLDVTLHGAIADVELHQRILNPGPAELAAMFEHELPVDASVIGFALRDRGTALGVGVGASGTATIVDAPDVLGVDPALVQRTDINAAGRAHYRAIVQPIAVDREIMLALRWTQIADIHDGALHVPLFGKLDGSPCLVRVRPQLGPGVSITHVRAAGAELGKDRTFTLGGDTTIDVELAFARPEPIAWLQTEALGDGFTAEALTVIAPPRHAATEAQRAVLVIDTSRSMELVGRARVRQLVHAISSALPPTAQIEAVMFDRTADRVLGGWRAADATAFAAIDDAIAKRPAQNGSDMAAAFALAHTIVADGGRGQAMIIAITDGVLGAVPDDALVRALASRIDTARSGSAGPRSEAKPRAEAIDVHAIVLDPPHMPSPGGDLLRAPVSRYGGTYVEVDASALDQAIAEVASWLRPAWVDVAAPGIAVPEEVRAGAGFVATDVTRKLPKLAVTARSEDKIAIAPRAAPAAAIAQLALARAAGDDSDTAQMFAKLRMRHVAVDGEHELAVLATSGRVAQSRANMIAGGGPYARVVAVADPPAQITITQGVTAPSGGSALDRTIVKRLLVDQLQPRAYSCYQRAIGRAPALAGTATVHVELARGEVTRVMLEGLGNADFDACLLDAAYGMSPPLPTPGYNVDDRTVVNYPLTFAVREQKPIVVPGDADSSSPLDIGAIAPAGRGKRLNVDPTTPLGNLKPSRSP